MDSSKEISAIAKAITKKSNLTTYWLVNVFGDRSAKDYSFLIYAYFRWVDDFIDSPDRSYEEKMRFIQRQNQLLTDLYAGNGNEPASLRLEEKFALHFAYFDSQINNSLKEDILRFFAVLERDVLRGGAPKTILEAYRLMRLESIAYMNLVRYFITGQRCEAEDPEEYYAGIGCKIVHLLRDFAEDLDQGRANISEEEKELYGVDLGRINDSNFREWVKAKARLADECLRKGVNALHRSESFKYKLASLLYCARYQEILGKIKSNNYCLASRYDRNLAEQVLFLIQLGRTLLNTTSAHYLRPFRVATHRRALPRGHGDVQRVIAKAHVNTESPIPRTIFHEVSSRYLKLRLVMPAGPEDKYIDFAPLGLMTIAALTPPNIELSLIDTRLEGIDYDEPVDLVGISVLTAHAPRAYEIARRYKERGACVVLGGIHPSMLPQEAIQHCDAVVIGEAESLWPRVVEDFKAANLQRFYRSRAHPKLNGLPTPRRDLANKHTYSATNVIQATRGCPYDCEFCTVPAFFGKRYRCRPIHEVEKELLSLDRSAPVFFVDDNIVGKKSYAKALFRMLSKHRIRWVGQAPLTIAKDGELLQLARRSGCMALVIGFESLEACNINTMGKHTNKVEDYQEQIRRIHDVGIGIMGSFIFGYDFDNEATLEKTVCFAQEMKLEFAQFPILMPLPGSPLYRRLEQAGRILDRDWSHYDGTKVVFRPNLISAEALLESTRLAYRRFYSCQSIGKRLIKRLSNLREFAEFLTVNLILRQSSSGL